MRARMVSIAVVLFTATSCRSEAPVESSGAGKPASAVVLDERSQAAGGIEVSVARPEPWLDAVDAPGVLRLDERRTVRLGALVDAAVSAVNKNVGDSVRVDEPLATLHSHMVHDGWADFRKAQADVRRLTSDLAFSRDARDRMQRLLADKAVAAQELRRAETDVTSHAEALAAAEAEVTRATEELEHLGIDANAEPVEGHPTESIALRSPLAGQVIERLVTPGTTVSAGQALFVVSDLTRLWLVAEIDERFLARLSTGRTIALTVSAYPGETFPATVTAIADAIDPTTRRVQVRCEVPNLDRRLKPEMFALVRLTTTERNAVFVPANAVQTLDGQSVVFIERAAGQFEPRAVLSGQVENGRVPLLEGVASGDRVVTTGAFLLKSQRLQAGQE